MDNLNKKTIIIASVIVLIIIFVLIWYVNHTGVLEIYDNFMEGLWIASDDFCKRSDIDSMLLFIGPRESDTYKAYMIIFAENKIALNEKLEIRMPYWGMIAQNDIENQLDINNESLGKIMPLKLSAKIDIGNGKMVWENDDIVYAELYKDTLSTKKDSFSQKSDLSQKADSETII
jgi:hypothetical protein